MLRKASGSVVDCLRSWTYLHNETGQELHTNSPLPPEAKPLVAPADFLTVNIFSHLLGAVLFLSLPVYVFATSLPPRYAVATTADVVVITVYLVGVAVCFVLSATQAPPPPFDPDATHRSDAAAADSTPSCRTRSACTWWGCVSTSPASWC